MHAAHMRTGHAPPGTALPDGMTMARCRKNGFLLACRPAAGGVRQVSREPGDPAEVSSHVMWDGSRGKVGETVPIYGCDIKREQKYTVVFNICLHLSCHMCICSILQKKTPSRSRRLLFFLKFLDTKLQVLHSLHQALCTHTKRKF